MTISGLGTAFTAGVISFIATNIDDIIILLLFFSQTDLNFRCRHVVIGQYLGFTIIVVASLPGFFGGLVVPSAWIGLLGILPIVIGARQLLDRDQDTVQVQTVISKPESDLHNSPAAFLISILHPQTYKVAAVTLANGGDNISIYIPLFAGRSLPSLGVVLGVFFCLVGVWCAIAYLLTRQPTIAYGLSRYGQTVVPFVLIGLGLFIMYERGTFSLLFGSRT